MKKSLCYVIIVLGTILRLRLSQIYLLDQYFCLSKLSTFYYNSSPYKLRTKIKMNYQFSLYDQQEKLIDKEVHKIKSQKSATIPYLTSSFNLQFDNLLKTLIVEYEFDLDKVALHLYYLFPVYELKITSRTVGVRWWQLMMEDRLQRGIKEDIECVNKNEDNQQLQKQGQQLQMIGRQNENGQQYKLINEIEQINNTKVLNRLVQQSGSFCSYRQALEQSLVLQQEQCDRLIMYKPKFIIDSQYKLQRYEMLDQQQNNKGNSGSNLQNVNNNNVQNLNNNQQTHKNSVDRQQTGIQQMLRKVVSNQFIYDEFGTFISMNNLQQNNNKISIQQQNINWWQHQIYSDKSSYQIYSGESSQEGNFNDSKDNIKYQQEKQQQNNGNDKQIIHSSVNKLMNKQYQIDDNWDQYQSD